MGQRVYLPRKVELDIGAINVTPASTNIGLGARHEYKEYRPLDESYPQYEVGQFGRSLTLAGVYAGAEADAFRALIGSGSTYAFRLLLDQGQDNRVHAGMVLPENYELTTPSEEVSVVTGSAQVDGAPYIGAGVATLAAGSNSQSVTVAHDAIVYVVRTAGVRASVPTPATVTWTAQQGGGATFAITAQVDAATGAFIVHLPDTGSGNAARPSSGDWTIRASTLGYATLPALTWTALRAEGTFG